jgi:hypothetical protein
VVISIVLSLYAFVAYAASLRRYFSGWIDTGVAAFVLALGQIVLSELILGFANLLSSTPLMICNLLASTFMLLINCPYIIESCLDFWEHLKRFMGVLCRSPVSLGVAFALVAMLIWTLWLIWILPESSYDGLAYHLPIALSRLDRADMSRLTGWPPWIHSYPEYSELMMLWTIIFGRRLILVDGVQWPFWVIGIVATYGLARKLGASTLAAFQGSAVLGFTPVVALQSRVAYNDLMVGVLFLISLNLLLAKKGMLSTFVAGLAASIIAGIKYPGVLYPLFTGLGLLILNWLRKESRGRRWGGWCRLLIFLAPIIVLAVPWYVGNWLAYGNPLWPFTLYVQDRLLFKGLFTLDWLYRDMLQPRHRELPGFVLNSYIWLEPARSYSHDAHYGGLGVLWIVLGIPSLVYALLTVSRHRRRLLLWLLMVVGGLYLTVPDNWWPRYALFLPGLGAVGVAWVLHHASVWLRRFAQSVLVLGVFFSVLTATTAGPASIETIVAYAHLPATERPTLGLLNWPAYRWWNCNTYSGTTVAYGYGLYFIAPLWGDDLHNHVVYAGNSEEELTATIAKTHAGFVFVERHPENAWLDSVSDLTRVYEDEQFSIYYTISAGP